MSEPKDGGSAFPQLARRGYMLEDGTITPIGDGMSLRDYFAAAALQGFCANPEMTHHNHRTTSEMAFDAADAMLAARTKGGA